MAIDYLLIKTLSCNVEPFTVNNNTGQYIPTMTTLYKQLCLLHSNLTQRTHTKNTNSVCVGTNFCAINTSVFTVYMQTTKVFHAGEDNPCIVSK